MTIEEQIKDLEVFKGCLNHFLASYSSVEHPELKSVAEANKSIIKDNLHLLYRAKHSQVKKPREGTVTIRRVYNASENEVKAIDEFNKDRRFTITE